MKFSITFLALLLSAQVDAINVKLTWFQLSKIERLTKIFNHEVSILELEDKLRNDLFAPGMVVKILNGSTLFHGDTVATGVPDFSPSWFANTDFIPFKVLEAYCSFDQADAICSMNELRITGNMLGNFYFYSDRPWNNLTESSANLRLIEYMNTGTRSDLPIEPVFNSTSPDAGFAQDDRLALAFCGVTKKGPHSSLEERRFAAPFGAGYMRPNMQFSQAVKKKIERPWELVWCDPVIGNFSHEINTIVFDSIQAIRDEADKRERANETNLSVLPLVASGVLGDEYCAAVQQGNVNVTFDTTALANSLPTTVYYQELLETLVSALSVEIFQGDWTEQANFLIASTAAGLLKGRKNNLSP